VTTTPQSTPDGEGTLWARMSDMCAGPSLSLQVAPDPLGPVNKILTLMHNDGRGGSTRLATLLHPIHPGQEVQLTEENTPVMKIFAHDWSPIRRWGGHFWVVTVDDKRILEVPYAAALPDIPPAPRVPLKRRLRSWVTKRARSAADGVAGRLGYHRDGECGGDW
jgi:antitoxin (DNA-binding transcriptional repressor) of toxin-antitoxin stability system